MRTIGIIGSLILFALPLNAKEMVELNNATVCAASIQVITQTSTFDLLDEFLVEIIGASNTLPENKDRYLGRTEAVIAMFVEGMSRYKYEYFKGDFNVAHHAASRSCNDVRYKHYFPNIPKIE